MATIHLQISAVSQYVCVLPTSSQYLLPGTHTVETEERLCLIANDIAQAKGDWESEREGVI